MITLKRKDLRELREIEDEVHFILSLYDDLRATVFNNFCYSGFQAGDLICVRFYLQRLVQKKKNPSAL